MARSCRFSLNLNEEPFIGSTVQRFKVVWLVLIFPGFLSQKIRRVECDERSSRYSGIQVSEKDSIDPNTETRNLDTLCAVVRPL